MTASEKPAVTVVPPMPDLQRVAVGTRIERTLNRRNFFKVEMWTKDGLHIQRRLFAGTSLDWAPALFAAFARKRPQGRLTVRLRVLAEWPKVNP
jgi:hypothetical protein